MKAQPYYIVRTSRIHGKGVFAKRPIRKGVLIIEYTGDIISSKKADKIGSTIDEHGHGHTMLFKVDEDRVINGTVGGPAKYINHSCAPNAEAVQYDDDKIFIEALRAIKPGEEITYDYNLQIPGKIDKAVKKEYACFCGSPQCRGTQIAPEILEKQAMKDEKKRKKKEKKKAKKELKKKKKAQEKTSKKRKKKDKMKDKREDTKFAAKMKELSMPSK